MRSFVGNLANTGEVANYLVTIVSGVSNFFSSGARLRTAGAPRPEAGGFTSARSAERGRVGEGSPPPAGGGPGGLPREIFRKLLQNGAFWCILRQ